jgi:hypothetical protein
VKRELLRGESATLPIFKKEFQTEIEFKMAKYERLVVKGNTISLEGQENIGASEAGYSIECQNMLAVVMQAIEALIEAKSVL